MFYISSNKWKTTKKSKGNYNHCRDVYCTCRRTYLQQGIEESPDNFLASYCVCEDWYHKNCMNIPLKVFGSDTIVEVWKCKSCKQEYL